MWFEDPSKENQEIVDFRFTRVCFGVILSMALLGNVLYNKFEKYRGDYPKLIQEVKKLSVDDLSLGGDDTNIVYQKYEQCNGI